MNRHERRANAKRNRSTSFAGPVGTELAPAEADLLKSAIVHHRAGRMAEAESLYRQVLAAQPDHAPTHCNLGVVLQEQGKLDEAIAAYREALADQPALCVATRQPWQRVQSARQGPGSN